MPVEAHPHCFCGGFATGFAVFHCAAECSCGVGQKGYSICADFEVCVRASGSSRSSANKFVNLCSEVHDLPSNFSCVLFRGDVCRTKPGAFGAYRKKRGRYFYCSRFVYLCPFVECFESSFSSLGVGRPVVWQGAVWCVYFFASMRFTTSPYMMRAMAETRAMAPK